MAIYTNYGRYLKAKQFKENLESAGDTYMVFGIGNPLWDSSNDEDKVEIPIAPYNTEIMTVGDVNTNQFFDDQAAMYFNYRVDSISGLCEAMLENSRYILPTGENDPAVQKYMYLCRRLIPPFPCVYQSNINYEGAQPINIQNYFITKETNKYMLRSVSDPSSSEQEISLPSTTSLEMQYFTEMYLRGKVLWNPSGGTGGSGALRESVKPMVGLLGAVKCKVDFVKDIGPEGNNNYTGGINQFWYGDRYWEIIDPTDDIIHINDDSSLYQYLETGNSIEKNQGTYPHHLIFTATVNPRYLCDELEIDQYVVPRQIAIYTRPRVDGVEGPHYYRAYEHVFSFGQYNSDEEESAKNALGESAEILNFSLPCDCGDDYTTANGEFKFLLNDYIRGQIRESHSIDRFGYVIGF